MKKLLLILIGLVFVSGCGQTLKNSWGNFRAYYNTYYNAEKNFNTGLKKVQDQPQQIDPAETVRIHPAPVQAGNSDFQKAIDKGAKILRKFPGSKWTDDALLLIGKSYYYRQEFYPARQKFEELYNATSSPEMKQLAIIWKGRTLLDLNLHRDGVTYLEEQLDNYPADWSTTNRAEIKSVVAEHHAMLENWTQSADYLSEAVTNMSDRNLLGRTLFMYGQVLEKLERFGEAYFAFSRVSENFPGFEYIYWARFKQADVARKEGNLEIALNIYRDLRKDDKNIQRRGDLSFEIARTYEMMGQVDQAEMLYKSLLHSDQDLNSGDIRGDIYYRLGKIYSEEYNDFSAAAAYFDSSSTVSENAKAVNFSEDPQTLADAFGKYTRLQTSINRADSLLYLGSLSATELDSAIKRIRVQKRQAQLAKRETDAQNILANRDLTGTDEESTASSRYGFLNHRNADLVNRSKAEFQIVWGNRPLIDNWRRMEIVRQSNVSGTRRDTDPRKPVSGQQEGSTVVEMNLEDIPTSPEQRNKLQVDKANAQYELGNLMFLNLNLPDSARHYYHRVLKNKAVKELHPRAMYSLYELYESSGNQDSTRYWRERIIKEYPRSRYAQRFQKNTADVTTGGAQDSAKRLVQQFQAIQAEENSDQPQKLRKLALANRSSDLAPTIHYQAIEAYIRQAKARDSTFDAPVTGDSLKSVADDSLAVDRHPQYQGAYWDSVRAVVHEFDTTFSNAKQRQRVITLREMLKKPAADSASTSQLPTCKDLGISLSVDPGMDEFLSNVEYPDKLEDMSISGEVVYDFIVTRQGTVESYQLTSQRTSLGIEDAFEKAFEESLKFKAPRAKEMPDKIKCRVSFPIQF